QMYSQRYGTPPIVRKTGGLADTVEPYNPTTGGGTGFVFEHYTPEGLSWAWDQALSTFRNPSAWHRLMVAGMSRDFSWETQIREYERVYEALISGRL
ncbi:MAG TPA: hypothetical protein PK413_16200, partial [Thermoanaerobaculia bacterium]|nr:hypothetical protein [Thermoanaerobaculia bacterium]